MIYKTCPVPSYLFLTHTHTWIHRGEKPIQIRKYLLTLSSEDQNKYALKCDSCFKTWTNAYRRETFPNVDTSFSIIILIRNKTLSTMIFIINHDMCHHILFDMNECTQERSASECGGIFEQCECIDKFTHKWYYAGIVGGGVALFITPHEQAQ